MTAEVLETFEAELPDMRELALDEIERRAERAEEELAAAPSVSAGVEESLKKLQKQVRSSTGRSEAHLSRSAPSRATWPRARPPWTSCAPSCASRRSA